jgi:hypothetical protein
VGARSRRPERTRSHRGPGDLDSRPRGVPDGARSRLGAAPLVPPRGAGGGRRGARPPRLRCDRSGSPPRGARRRPWRSSGAAGRGDRRGLGRGPGPARRSRRRRAAGPGRARAPDRGCLHDDEDRQRRDRRIRVAQDERRGRGGPRDRGGCSLGVDGRGRGRCGRGAAGRSRRHGEPEACRGAALYRASVANNAGLWGSGSAVTWQPVADGVLGLAYTYFDDAGRELPPPGGAEDARADRSRIASVAIALLLAERRADPRWIDPADPDPETRSYRKVRLGGRIGLRNQRTIAAGGGAG